MPATTTLASTTLSVGCDDKAQLIKVASTAGMFYGQRLYITTPGSPGGELVKVMRLDVDPWVVVSRGQDGTRAVPHSSGETVYIGRADQFYFSPPVGRPSGSVEVSPYIDARNGNIYFAQGDTTPSASAVRWWQLQTNLRVVGPLGSTTSTLDPTSST